MWIFTETGFVSAVQHRENPDYLMVRARDAQSLESLATMISVEIKSTPTADYPYRLVAAKEDVKSWMNDNIDFLGYSNFKNQVAITRGKEYAYALGSVWSTMHEVEDEEARKRLSEYESSLGFSRS
jgi:hypothetical protein